MLTPQLIAEIIGVTASGALSPGPLTFAVVAGGSRKGARFGILAATGHMAFEFPLYLLLGFGAASFFRGRLLRAWVSLLGGAALLAYAALILYGLVKGSGSQGAEKAAAAGGFMVGLLFTALNPYFIIWWATAGLKLTLDIWGAGGAPVLVAAYPFHVWMDYAWLGSLALLAYRGRRLSERLMDAVQVVLAVLLVYYGWVFLSEGAALLSG